MTKLVKVSICIALAVVWLLWLRPLALGGPASYIIVSGTSMEPTLHDGDLALLHAKPDYMTDDIIAFGSSSGIVIHRIVGGSAEEGYVVQGDNKNAPDPWQPKPDQILGKLWLHIPGAGRVVSYLRQPAPFATLVGGIALLALLGGAKTRRRWRRGKRMANSADHDPGSSMLPASPQQLAWLAAQLLLGLAFAGTAFLLFRQPVEISRYVERLHYEHASAFDYTVQVEPSTLYPDGTVGPVTAPPPGATPTAAPPIYAKLARSLDLGFAYNLASSLPSQVSGEISADLRISAGKDGWSKTRELLPPTPFTGPTASARLSVNLAPIWALIETIEKETEVQAGAYDLVILPKVHIVGTLGSESIDEVYQPAFTVKLTRTLITPEPQLARSEPRSIGEAITSPAIVTLAGLSVEVGAARWASAGLAALLLLAAGLLAARIFLGLGGDEVAKVRARHGSLIVTVQEAYLRSQRIEVASMEDLARLADRDGRIILHQERGPEADVYFVHDGDLVYTYTVARPNEQATVNEEATVNKVATVSKEART
mgnify:CR=1 FL=1